jgi:colanic acid/amylovoran biosynthesis glycosyltransferase
MSIAYVVSKYPTLSHSFIRREIQALREKGLQIQTFTLRPATDAEVISPDDRRERDETFTIQGRGPRDIVADHLLAFWGAPASYLRTLGRALGHRTPGARSALWSLFHFAEAMVLARQLKGRDIRHVHAHFSNAGGVVAMLASSYLGIGWSLTIHGSTADFESPTRVLLGDKVAATRFTACVSHAGRALALRASDPAVWDRFVVVRCGIQLDRFPYRPRVPQPGRRLRLLSVGRLAPEKGQRVLLRGFAELVQRGVDAELRLIGEGPERAALEKMVVDLKLQDRCLLPGSRPEAEVAQEMAQADLFVLSSFVEGLPVVLMEAMASGLPVVAPRISGIPELVVDGETGTLFSAGNWHELADKLQSLAADGLGLRAVVERARAKVEREFDIRVAVGPLLDRFADAAVRAARS